MKRVLVVDDEKIVQLSCMRSLESAGYDAEAVNDGVEGLARLQEQEFDYILTDLKMPNMDGLEFIQILRRTAPDAKIMLITGYATDEARETARSMGAGFLEKPFTPSMLIDALREL